MRLKLPCSDCKQLLNNCLCGLKVYKIRRHRRLGDRFELPMEKYDRERRIYEIVGLCGQGLYGVVRVLDGKAGTYQLTMQLSIWIETTSTKRPYPFEGVA